MNRKREWAAAVIASLLLVFTPFGPDARADEVSDAAARQGLNAEQERIQRCIRYYESTDGKYGDRGNGGGDYQYERGKPENQHDVAAGHIKDGSYTRRWRAQAGRCWGGGGGGSKRRAPAVKLVDCTSHSERFWTSEGVTAWRVVTYRAPKCDYPAAPENAGVDPGFRIAACGWWTGGEEPVWHCPYQTIAGKGRL